MIRTRVSTIIAMLVLLSLNISIASAQHNHGGGSNQGMGNSGHQMPKVKTGSIKCQVMEMKEGGIVVDGKYQGKAQHLTLRMDSSTKVEGQIEPGSKVTIRYREDLPGSLYATAVKGPKQKKS